MTKEKEKLKFIGFCAAFQKAGWSFLNNRFIKQEIKAV
jgi:hypothetical protein